MLLRQGVTFVQQQEKKIFSAKPKVDELYGKSVCVVGAGTIGKEIAKRCTAFGMTVYGVSRKANRTRRLPGLFRPINKQSFKNLRYCCRCLAVNAETRNNYVNPDFIMR